MQSTETESRRERQRRQLIAEVMGIARKQLAAGGKSGVTWRAIAREVGINPASLYTYFDSLDDLFTALILQSYERLANAIDQAGDHQASDPLERFLDFASAYRQWALANPAEFNLIFTDQLGDFAPDAAAGTYAAEMRVLGPFVSSLGESLGATPPLDDPESSPPKQQHRFMSVYAQLYGLVSLEANNHFPTFANPDELLRARLRESIRQLADAPSD